MSRSDETVPSWDDDRARWLVGKHVLVGVTHLASDGKTVVTKEQFHGMIMTAVEGQGITIACLGGPKEGQTVTLPPVTTPYLDAKPGEYRLRATGEVVTNPDVTVSWTITQQAQH
jgi:hypothetical protein